MGRLHAFFLQFLHFFQYQIASHRGNNTDLLHFTKAHTHSHVICQWQNMLQYVHKLCLSLYLYVLYVRWEGWMPLTLPVVLNALGSNIFLLCPICTARILVRFACNVEMITVLY